MAPNGFEMLPHTADTRMRVRGKTLEEVFRNALRGVAFYLNPRSLELPKKVKQGIKVEAVDLNSLLVEFLSETIAQSDIKNVIFSDVGLKKFGEDFLEGTLWGAGAGNGFEKEIKAVSYHEVDIKKNPATGLYETILVFDV